MGHAANHCQLMRRYAVAAPRMINGPILQAVTRLRRKFFCANPYSIWPSSKAILQSRCVNGNQRALTVWRKGESVGTAGNLV